MDYCKKIKEKIGGKSKLKYKGFGTIEGTIENRSCRKVKGVMGEYYPIIDYIVFDKGSEQVKSIRFGFYKLSKDRKLVWNRFAAFIEEIPELKELFKVAANEIPEFRAIIEEVYQALSQATP